MTNALQSDHYQFDNFLYSPTEAVVIKMGKRIILKARENELLHQLVLHYPNITSRETIHDNLWKNSYTTDATINQTVKALRDDLGDVDKTIIRTIPKSGYMLGLTPKHVAFDVDENPLISAKQKAKITSQLPFLFFCLATAVIGFNAGVLHTQDKASEKVLIVNNVHYFFTPTDIELARFSLLAKTATQSELYIERTEQGYRYCEKKNKEMTCRNAL